jgi:hypothetical protein
MTREAVATLWEARREHSGGVIAGGGSRALPNRTPFQADADIRIRTTPVNSSLVRGLHETGVNGGTDQLIAALSKVMSIGLGAISTGSLPCFLASGSLKRSERGWGETRLGKA